MTTLAKKVAALRPGDYVRATFKDDGHNGRFTITGEVWELCTMPRVGGWNLCRPDGQPHEKLCDVELVERPAPEYLPEDVAIHRTAWCAVNRDGYGRWWGARTFPAGSVEDRDINQGPYDVIRRDPDDPDVWRVVR